MKTKPFHPVKNPRFVWCVGAIDDAFPDIGAEVLHKPGTHLYDRQEKKIVATLNAEYQSLFCLETTANAASQPMTTLESWLNQLGAVALKSENIPATKRR